jgi:hypothetical protein
METPPFTCPHCDTVLILPDDAWYYTCPQCGKRLDLKSQFAYLRGLDAFSEGQEIIDKISPRKHRVPFQPQVTSAMQLFMEAYSSMQVAFQAELAEEQRYLGVEMMSSMVNEFMRRSMVSAFEMTYWNTLAVEQVAQREYDRLKEKLASPAGFLGPLKRLRWRARQKQLVKSLAEIDQKLRALERQIEFTEVPRARNEKWKPT